MERVLVDITPDVSLLRKMGQSGHSVAEAVAELVDNALDARVDGGPVRVEVTYNAREGWLKVQDDGAGMSRRELSAALVLALSQKDDADIGKFGLGLKTACTSLGDAFEVVTAQRDDQLASVARYDTAEFLQSGDWKLPISRQEKERPRGTTVVVRSERLYAGLHQSLHRNLGWTFRHFLLDGVLYLSVNGVSVAPADYEIRRDSVMPFEGEVAGVAVRGWAGLLQKSSQRGWYGFALIRNRRIVRRHEKLGFQAHPSTARVVGELHLDGFDTNNLKTDFIRETAAWRELEEWVSAQIEPVLAESRALAHAGMLDLKVRARIEAERGRVLGDADRAQLLKLPTAPTGGAAESASRAVAVAVGPMHLEHVFARDGEAAPYVTAERVTRMDEADLVVVRTNLDHPAASTVSDRSGWACHNLAEVAAQGLGSAAEFVQLKSIVLAKLLGERGLRRALSDAGRDFLREPARVEAV